MSTVRQWLTAPLSQVERGEREAFARSQAEHEAAEAAAAEREARHYPPGRPVWDPTTDERS